VRKSKGDAEFQGREVDIDAGPQLLQKLSDEVPVVFINGRKAFKYRWIGDISSDVIELLQESR
jgi:hypothetical protein